VYFNTQDDKNGVAHNMSEFLTRGQWKPDTYNRLQFWMRVPQGIVVREDGGYNMHVANFVRLSTEKREQESTPDGEQGHYYYYFNIPDLPMWYHVEVDLNHPHHLRNEQTKEWGIVNSPFDESGHNMADSMTKFYIDLKQDDPKQPGKKVPLAKYPATFDFDSFEIAEIPADDNITQVYNVTAGYDPKKNLLSVNWSRSRDEDNVLHDLRWSLTDIRQSGWDKATPCPDGEGRKGLGGGGYNAMMYKTDQIPLRGKKEVYLAIKPQNSDQFRQIELSLVSAS